MTSPAADCLLGARSEDGSLLARVAVTTGLCRRAWELHHTSPTATAALGRALTGALLLGSLLKGRQSVLLQWRGDGPLGAVVAEAKADLTARGYVSHPQAEVPSRGGKLDVGAAVGRNGQLVVVKDYGLKEPYVSTVPLQTGEMGDDLAFYLLSSEQIPSAVALGVYVARDRSVEAAGGILVEALPSASPQTVDRAAENLAHLGSVTEVLRAGEGADGLLARALEGIPFSSVPLGEPAYVCSCSPERLEATLAALGDDEVRAILEQEGEIRAQCAFCAAEWRKKAMGGRWRRADGRG
ncbi:MAG: Hsp33 family molecular chaperone HslO [Deferrisomatales bacterium]